ncbi:MAG TPA: Gfo/Idh/MocA family oxidoreductase [Desulfomonilia bacterium]
MAFKAGIIGAGNAGNWHANSVKKIPELAEVAAIADLDDKCLKRVGRKNPGADLCTDYHDILKRPDIDCIHICLPHHLHAKICVEAFEAGKHVLCEKPIANTLEEADAMIAAGRKAGKILMIAENQLFLPAHRKMKELIDAGVIGLPKLVRTYEGGSEVNNMSDPTCWKGKVEESGGGAWIDSGIHRVGVVLYLIGDIDSISGRAARCMPEMNCTADDNCSFSVGFEKGAIGSIDCSFTVASEWNNTIEIYGTKGTILEDHNREQPLKLFSTLPGPDQGKWVCPEVEHRPYPGYYPLTFELEVKHFYECVSEGREPFVTGEFGKKALEVILLGYEASETGRTIYRNKN